MRRGCALLCALLLAGCAMPYSPAPRAVHYPNSSQNKAQAAAHWLAITGHIERELLPTLKRSKNSRLYVVPAQDTPFNQAVTGQLITALVNDGQVVVTKPEEGALTVDIDTQVVAFSADRPQYKYRGELTALTAGAWAITHVHHTPAGLATAAIAAHDAYSWFRSKFASGETPKTEIIVTVSVADEQRYVARSTSVYYVTDSDRSLYEAMPAPTTKTFTVRGG